MTKRRKIEAKYGPNARKNDQQSKQDTQAHQNNRISACLGDILAHALVRKMEVSRF